MLYHKLKPIDSFDTLRTRVERLLRDSSGQDLSDVQLSLDIASSCTVEPEITGPGANIIDFLDLLADSLPDGDLYLFGGVLRDLALFGKRGFNSDIDLVVDGNWAGCVPYLDSLGAKRNKFGGYRLTVAGWAADIWSARETWAIKNGYVEFKGVASLIDTTVLNWDAILMNWRTRQFISEGDYLDTLKQRYLDIVLEKNPNPLGMAVRVFRHLSLKDARKVSLRAANYLATSTKQYSLETLRHSELNSYGNTVIEPAVYDLFEGFNTIDIPDAHARWQAATHEIQRRGIGLTSTQKDMWV